GGPVFDVPKLDWLNGRYLRERLDTERFAERVGAWGFAPERIARIAALAQPRIERLSDMGNLLAFFFAGRLSYDPALFVSGKIDAVTVRKALAVMQRELELLRTWESAGIDTLFRRVAQAMELKVRDLTRPFYVAVTGSPTSVPLYDAMEILGRDIVRERLRHALDMLGAPSKRELEEWKHIGAATSEISA
ncbi:MAG: glutamate--tRNA ligase, partial [Candidatus Baltobacteraceae bacterium]